MILEKLTAALKAERDAIDAVIDGVDGGTAAAIEAMRACRGRIVFMGVGKSGHIGAKLAATFSSTGTPAIFVHGTEACHGDLGMILSCDLAVLISNSGNTAEVVQNLTALKSIGCKTVAMTAGRSSALARGCDCLLAFPNLSEADHLGLAPTCSSTAALALGDAIACVLSGQKGFTRADFYRCHPGGALGERLKGTVSPDGTESEAGERAERERR